MSDRSNDYDCLCSASLISSLSSAATTDEDSDQSEMVQDKPAAAHRETLLLLAPLAFACLQSSGRVALRMKAIFSEALKHIEATRRKAKDDKISDCGLHSDDHGAAGPAGQSPSGSSSSSSGNHGSAFSTQTAPSPSMTVASAPSSSADPSQPIAATGSECAEIVALCFVCLKPFESALDELRYCNKCTPDPSKYQVGQFLCHER